jgi:hypothetical protein
LINRIAIVERHECRRIGIAAVIIECAASRLYDPEIAAVMIEGGDEGVTLPNRMFCEDVLNSHNNWLPTRDGVFQDPV